MRRQLRLMKALVGLLMWGEVAMASLLAKPYEGAEVYSKERIKFGKIEFRMKTEYAAGGLVSLFSLR